MARPIKPRTAETLVRDIETLSRLRTSLRLDRSLDTRAVDTAIGRIDALVSALVALLPPPGTAPASGSQLPEVGE